MSLSALWDRKHRFPERLQKETTASQFCLPASWAEFPPHEKPWRSFSGHGLTASNSAGESVARQQTMYTGLDWVTVQGRRPTASLISYSSVSSSVMVKPIGNPSTYIRYWGSAESSGGLFIKKMQSRVEDYKTHAEDRARRESEGRQTWRGMLIKLWTWAILLPVCFAFPYENGQDDRWNGLPFLAGRTQ